MIEPLRSQQTDARSSDEQCRPANHLKANRIPHGVCTSSRRRHKLGALAVELPHPTRRGGSIRSGNMEVVWMPRIYVGNLASSVTSRDLHSHFERAGEVTGALAISDKATGRCRGFGFVEMAELSDVVVAFSLLSNSELKGQKITIERDPALKNGRARNKAAH